MDTRFKRMEDIVRRLEEMISIRIPKVEEPRANDGNIDRETEV